MDDPLPLFQKIGDDSITDEKYVNVQVRLERPIALNYTIRGFLDERNTTDGEIFEKRLSIYHGVDANFEFDTWGKVAYPSQFERLRCNFMVNPLAGTEYIEYASKGYVGDGWLENDEFLFRLYLAPEVARNLIEKEGLGRKLISSIADYDDEDDNDNGNGWLDIRLDLVNYQYLESHGHKVWFDIIRTYVY